MSEPDEIRFACIGCGAMNPVGAETCSGCGHRFGGPDHVSPAGHVATPRPRPASSPLDYYEAPVARPARAPTFRIGSAMAFIAVVGVCLGAFVASPVLGIFATIGALPAMIRTIAVAGRREAQGWPMDPGEEIATFVMTAGAAYLVTVSSAIAFGVTCVSIGVTVGGAGFPVGVLLAIGSGLVAALFVGVKLSRGMLRASRAREQGWQDRESIRWR